MAAIALGFKPIAVEVTLARGANFFTTFTNAQGWDDGITIEMRFPTPSSSPSDWVTWEATLTSTKATWNVPASQVHSAITVANNIGGSGRARVRVHYIDADGTDLLWMEGPVYVA